MVLINKYHKQMWGRSLTMRLSIGNNRFFPETILKARRWRQGPTHVIFY